MGAAAQLGAEAASDPLRDQPSICGAFSQSLRNIAHSGAGGSGEYAWGRGQPVDRILHRPSSPRVQADEWGPHRAFAAPSRRPEVSDRARALCRWHEPAGSAARHRAALAARTCCDRRHRYRFRQRDAGGAGGAAAGPARRSD